jgi:hypothetical protein
LAGKVTLADSFKGASVYHQSRGIDVEIHAFALLPQAEALEELFGDELQLLALPATELMQETIDGRLIGEAFHA